MDSYSREDIYHLARVEVDGKQSFDRAKAKKRAEIAAAFRYLNGVYLTEKRECWSSGEF